MNNKKSFKKLLKILLVQITLLIGLSSIITAFANPVVNITGSETAEAVPEPVEIEENTEAIEQEEVKDDKDEIMQGEQPLDEDQEASQEEQVTQAETPEETVQVQETTDTPEIAVQAATDASNFNFDASTGTITSLSQNCTLSDIVIPKQIGGVDVVSIGEGAFKAFNNITSIRFEDECKISKIGNNVFQNSSNLVSVILPDSITSIPDYCFDGCSALTSVEMGKNVASIGAHAFSKTNISDIQLCDTVSSIGSGAFMSTKLTTVILPDGIVEIPSQCFYNCTKLKQITLSPKTETIEYYAFYSTGLASIDLPDTITSIGSHAFSFSKLTSIVLPNNLKSIEPYLFSYCISLQNVTIGNNLESIGQYAFTESGLKEIKFPETVTSIGAGAFRKCTKLTSITLPKNLTAINNHLFFECYNLKNITIPNGIKKIGSFIISDTQISEINIPESVEIIPNDAFSPVHVGELGSLKKIYITSKETNTISGAPWGANDAIVIWKNTIIVKDDQGNDKYVYDSSTKTITKYIGTTQNDVIDIESDFKNDNINSDVLVIGSKAFYGKDNISTVKLQNSIKVIEDEAFYKSSLKSISLSKDLVSIGKSAFNICKNLTSITIFDKVSELGVYAFANCSSLNNVNLGTGLDYLPYGVFERCTSLEEITVPGNIKNINSGAFSECDSLKFIRIPDYEKDKIPNAAWGAAYASVIWKGTLLVPEENPKYVYEYDNKSDEGTITKYIGLDEEANIEKDFKDLGKPITKIGNNAFYGCYTLKNVIVPNSVKKMGFNTFSGAYNLESISLSNNLLSVPSAAFYNCSKLKFVKLPNKLKKIESSAFKGCESLQMIELPNSVTSIETSVFENCKSLQNVKLPNSITKISGRTFRWCSSLKSVDLPESLKEIGYEAFCICTSLKSVDLPKTLVKIEYNAFSSCSSLQKIEIPDSITSLETRINYSESSYSYRSSVFSNCSSLTEVKLPRYLRKIPYGLFEDCTNLSIINIPDGVQKIEDIAFLNTAIAGKLVLPPSITSINKTAFSGVTTLDTLVIPYAKVKCPYLGQHPYGLNENNPTQIVYGGGIPNIKARVTPTKDSTGKNKYLLDFDIDFRDKYGNIYDAITRINLPDETGELSGNIINVGQRESWSTADNNKTLDVTQRAVYKIQIAGLDNKLHDYEILLGKIELENNEAEFYLGDMKTLTMNQILYRLGIIDKDGHTLIKDEFGVSVDCTYNISDEQMNAIHNMQYGDKLETKIGIHDPLLQKDYDISINVVSNAIRGKVVWDDNDNRKGLRPSSVNVNLYSKKANSSDAEKLVTTKAVTEGTDGNWSFDFEEASPWENKNVGGVVGTFHCGDELKYTISPTKPAHYSMVSKENPSDFFTITLTVNDTPLTGIVEGSNGIVLISLSIGLLILSSAYFVIKKHRKIIKK